MILAFTLTYSVPSEVDTINELFDNGIDYLHVHKPKIKKRELIEFIENINSKYHSKIVLHQHHSIAKRFKCEVIHFNYKKFNGFFNKLFLKFLRLNHPNLKVCSTVSPSKLSKIDADDIEYLLIGPIFKKYSEDNVRMLFDRFKLKKWVSSTNYKCFAYGAIDYNNVEQILQLGLDGVILNSAIWRSHQPLENFKAITSSIKADMGGFKSKAI